MTIRLDHPKVNNSRYNIIPVHIPLYKKVEVLFHKTLLIFITNLEVL